MDRFISATIVFVIVFFTSTINRSNVCVDK